MTHKLKILLLSFAIISGVSCAKHIQVDCPGIKAPAKLEKNISISITEKEIKVNDGGEKLLREYVGARAAIIAMCGE